MQHELIHQILLKKTDLVNLKCDVDKLDTDKLNKYSCSGPQHLKVTD